MKRHEEKYGKEKKQKSIIKNYIIDNDKIHAQIEENKKKPKKASGFTARLQKAMEDAEKQKKSRKRGF